jgi:hypothetical protein
MTFACSSVLASFHCGMHQFASIIDKATKPITGVSSNIETEVVELDGDGQPRSAAFVEKRKLEQKLAVKEMVTALNKFITFPTPIWIASVQTR